MILVIVPLNQLSHVIIALSRYILHVHHLDTRILYILSHSASGGGGFLFIFYVKNWNFMCINFESWNEFLLNLIAFVIFEKEKDLILSENVIDYSFIGTYCIVFFCNRTLYSLISQLVNSWPCECLTKNSYDIIVMVTITVLWSSINYTCTWELNNHNHLQCCKRILSVMYHHVIVLLILIFVL